MADTMSLWELYKSIKTLMDSGEDTNIKVFGDNGGDSFTIDGFTYVEGRLTLQISPAVGEETRED